MRNRAWAGIVGPTDAGRGRAVKMYLLYGLTATLLFALAATVSLMFMSPPNKSAEPVKAGSAKVPERKGGEGADPDKMCPLVRSKASPEELAQLLQSLRQRESTLKEKEGFLNQRQQQMEMVYQDIKSERSSSDAYHKQISEELRELTRKLEEVDRTKETADLKQQQLNRKAEEFNTNRQKESDANEQANIKRLTALYESMSPEGAARYFEQLSNSGKLDTAVKILAQMRERQAAKVLDALTDASLAAQFTERLRLLERPGLGAAPNQPLSSPPPQQ